MQNRYAGDIGDYVKLSILRRLGAKRRLGVLWWLYPDENHNADGKHTTYLQKPEAWRSRDPELFDALKAIVTAEQRNIAALEAANVLPGAAFHSDVIPVVASTAERRTNRAAWFSDGLSRVKDCDLVFLDPDNGLETSNFDPGHAKAGKSVALSELKVLQRPGRTIIVYHHQTRMPGGHHFELAHWAKRLGEAGFQVDALRASAYSARAFFLLDANDEVRMQAMSMTAKWHGKLTWHPGLA